jgi:hypothetical protein
VRGRAGLKKSCRAARRAEVAARARPELSCRAVLGPGQKLGFWESFRTTGFSDIYRTPRVGLGYGWMKVNVEWTMR